MAKEFWPKVLDPFSEEGVAKLRSLIGIEQELTSDLNTEVTRDNIRRFALGNGDDNPLWIDENYARNSRWNGMIAPPGFIRTLGTALSMSLPDIHAQFIGEEFELDQPVYLGDIIKATTSLADIVKKESKLYKQILIETREVKYTNQKNQVFRYRRNYLRHKRISTEGQASTQSIQIPSWKPEDIRSFEEARLSEERRGSNPRYWEDIQIGDELPPRIRGPLTQEDIIWHFIGEGGSSYTYGIGLTYKIRQQNPEVFIVNSQGAYESAAAAHWDWEFARRIGAPGPFDITAMRGGCISHMITDWIGDDGWLKRLSAGTRGFMILGDIVWYKGKVVDKYVTGDSHLVKLELWSENQRNERTTVAQAEVDLPSSGSTSYA